MGSLITVHPQVVEGISPKTMERAIARRARLNPAASDRLYRTARIIALAIGAVSSAAEHEGRYYLGAVFDDRIGVWEPAP